jgi:hypothetical protein
LLANNIYNYNWEGARCDACDKPCKSERGVKIHKSKTCYYNTHNQHRYFNREGQQQCFTGTKAESAAKITKMTAEQSNKPIVNCDGNALHNIFKFKYLGSIFAADGEQSHDIQRRIALAASRCGQLRHCFDSPNISTATKIKIYKAAVVSILTYGSEAWRLTAKAKAAINGVNARLISRITGKTAHEEASPKLRTFDVLKAIRKRKHQWLGHILRMDNKRLVKHTVRLQYESGDTSNMLADAPPTVNFAQLEKIAANRKIWKKTWQKPEAANEQCVEVSWNENAETAKVCPTVKQAPPKPKKNKTAAEKQTAKYRARDKHEAFFRINQKNCNSKRKHKKKAKQRGLSKPMAMTNKQRAAWARAHYEQHHQTTTTTAATTTPATITTKSTTTKTTAKKQTTTTTNRTAATAQWAAAAHIPSGALSPTPTTPTKSTQSGTPTQTPTPTTSLIHITASPITFPFPQSMIKMSSLDVISLSPIPTLSKKPLFLKTTLTNPLSPATSNINTPTHNNASTTYPPPYD